MNFITYRSKAIRLSSITSFYVKGPNLIIRYDNTEITIAFGSHEACKTEWKLLLSLVDA